MDSEPMPYILFLVRACCRVQYRLLVAQLPQGRLKPTNGE